MSTSTVLRTAAGILAVAVVVVAAFGSRHAAASTCHTMTFNIDHPHIDVSGPRHLQLKPLDSGWVCIGTNADSLETAGHTLGWWP